jgi:hypothetical protein
MDSFTINIIFVPENMLECLINCDLYFFRYLNTDDIPSPGWTS